MVVEKTGISIISKKVLGQFLIVAQPQVYVNGKLNKKLKWNREVFLHLEPFKNHQILINFQYFGKPVCQAIMEVSLNPGEIMKFRYKTPIIVYSPGKITRLQ
tara:strand:+ start:97 stop:402 length:306 start_codon:yes stop_codon:yes gene_type:complete